MPKPGLRLLQVRIWSVARTQAQILGSMRHVDGLEGAEGLVAYWRMNEPGAHGGCENISSLPGSGARSNMGCMLHISRGP